MLLFLDLALALAAGLTAEAAAVWASRSPGIPADPARATAREAGQAIRSHRRLRGLLASRFDRELATGLILTLAVTATVLAGIVLGVLAYLVRRVPALQELDRSVGEWAYDHRARSSTTGLDLVTSLGTAQLVIPLAAALVVFDFARSRSRSGALFLLTVLVGMEVITVGIKDLLARARPTFVPAATHLGPSFPSGHSATAAAFYAAAALVLGRRLHRRGRPALAAGAVAIAVAVAASRVLLDLHWLSDVIGGLALGWGWFALCAVIFGGRLLAPTAGVDTAAATAGSKTMPLLRRRRPLRVDVSRPEPRRASRRPRAPRSGA